MRGFLTQIVAASAVLAASFVGVNWIVSLRPKDPPVLRAEGLLFALRSEVVTEAAEVALTRRLPAVSAAWATLSLRAQVAGSVHYPMGEPEPGQLVGRPADRAEHLSAPPSDLIHVDLPFYRLQRELSAERVKQIEAQTGVYAAEIERFTELIKLGETNLALAQNALDRFQGRLGAGATGTVAVSDQQVEDAVLKVGQASSNLATQRAALRVARQNALAQESAVASAKHELALSALREADARITCSGEAYVQQRDVSEGSAVVVGDRLMQLSVISPLRIVVHVPADLYLRFSPDTKAEVFFPALPGWATRAHAARLGATAPEVDAATRSVRVEFWMENPPQQFPSPQLDGRLPAGLACEVALHLGKLDHTLWIPERALRFGGATPEVVRLTPDAAGVLRAELVPVALGIYQDGKYLMLRGDLQDPNTGPGLRAGDRIAVGDLSALRGGEAVRLLVDANPSP